MLYVGIFLTFILGLAFVHCLSADFSPVEKIGLAFPLGIGLLVVLMLLADQVGIPLRPMPLLLGEALLLTTLLLFLYGRRRNRPKEISLPSLKNTNLVWLLFIIAVVCLEYMNFSKCLYFPPSDRDSLAGFETIGYIVAQEHTLKGLSIFNVAYMPGIHSAASYITYAPLVQLSYAYVYALGAETSKIIPALMYLFFLIAFYAATSRAAGKTGAAIATFFVLLTPEMLAFSSLSMTNVIHAIFASLGVIYMALWFREREKKDLILCGALLGINTLCRTEGIVFTAAVLLLLFIDAFRRKGYKGFLQSALLALVPLLGWTLYTKINGLEAESIAITHPFLDTEKAATILTHLWQLYTNTTLYGWSFAVFLLAFLVNLWFLIQRKDSLSVLLAIALSSVFYLFIIYQIDYKWDSIENVLLYSVKRFLFCFIPMVWYFSVSNHASALLFRKLEQFLRIDQAR
ncbi:MAG: glycosyltransferase family 39 protein [Tannerellaceae bacterium]|jgi:4-amino-4-deoxy-L-arabinose transferase-like glycosyltransferase|nr:glycosyltransferase family 39 protein [Tannerellaceae bacterium]